MPRLKVAPPETWGRSTVQTACPLDCPDSCSLDVTVERGKVVKIDGSRLAPSTDGYICGKVRRFDRRVYGAKRLLHPAIRKGPKGSGEFERVSWDEALTLIAERMTDARDRHGAESVLPYYYGGSNGILTNDFEDARLFRRFGASHLLRTVCAAPTGAAATAMYGKMAGVAYGDYEDAQLIVVWGCNPSASGIHLVSHITRAQARGARLVSSTCRRRSRGRRIHLPVRPGRPVVALAVIHDLFRGPATGFLRPAPVRRTPRGSVWPIERAAQKPASMRAARTFAEWYGTTRPRWSGADGARAQSQRRRATMAILAPRRSGQVRRARRGFHPGSSGPGASRRVLIDVRPRRRPSI
jgi:hypothetical protein